VNALAGGPARLRDNILALSTLQALNYIAPLATVPYLVRVLGPATFGMLSFAQAIAGYLDLVTNYGLNFSATRAVARKRDNPDALAAIFWRTVHVRTVLMLASSVILAATVALFPKFRHTPLLYAGAFLNVVGSVTLPVWYFQGLERVKSLAAAQATARLLSIPALFVFVRRPEDCAYAAVIQGAVPLIASLILILIAGPFWPPSRRPSYSQIRATLCEGWPAFTAEAGFAVNAATLTVVLGLISGNFELGLYSAADKVIRSAVALLGPVTQALYPHLNRLRAQSADLALCVLRSSFGWISLTALCASIAAFALAGPAGRILWGPGFERAAIVLRCLSPLPFLLALVNALSVQTMLVWEMDSILSRLVLFAAIANIVFAGVGSAFLGAVGAAIAAVATAVFTLFLLARSAPAGRLGLLLGFERAV
jgi:O-antigen/teichoic acid export membrane protein